MGGGAEFKNLRNFVEVVSSNPLKFPKYSNTSSVGFKDSNEILLSLDFGKEIESGKIFNRSDIDS